MTDTPATRTPSGAAVPGTQAAFRPKRYPRILAVAFTEKQYAAIAAEASERGLSKGEVVRFAISNRYDLESEYLP